MKTVWAFMLFAYLLLAGSGFVNIQQDRKIRELEAKLKSNVEALAEVGVAHLLMTLKNEQRIQELEGPKKKGL
jgi:hypothetical protein